MRSEATPVLFREIRARFTAETITVYQAFRPDIAAAAVAAGTFVAPFKRERMTWIKPSFCWMMYRCGWATKPGQERVLAVEIRRAGFEWALAHACLSHYEQGTYDSESEWQQRKAVSSVRVQWDPERDVELHVLPYRAIQIGLSSEAVDRYVGDWITAVVDITTTVRELASLVAIGDLVAARSRLPIEQPYPLDESLRRTIAATAPASSS